MRYVGRYCISEKEFSDFTRLDEQTLKDFEIEYIDVNNKKQKVVIKNRLNIIYLDKNYNIKLTDIVTGDTQKFSTRKPYIKITFCNKDAKRKYTYIYMYKKEQKEHFFIKCDFDLISK